MFSSTLLQCYICTAFILMMCRSVSMEISSSHEYPLSTYNGCFSMKCGLGQECVREMGVAYCTCIKKCPLHFKLVCGSDGMVYPNYCHMHRRSCLRKEVIRRKPWTFCNVTKLTENSNPKSNSDYDPTSEMSNSNRDTNDLANINWEQEKSIKSTLEAVNSRSHDNNKHFVDVAELQSIRSPIWKVLDQPINDQAENSANGLASPNIRSIEVTIENVKSDKDKNKNNRKPKEDDGAPTNDVKYVDDRSVTANDRFESDDNERSEENTRDGKSFARICSYQQYTAFKDVLLGFMSRKLQPSSDHDSEDTREHNIASVFSRFDLNADGFLLQDELKKVNDLFSLSNFGSSCDVISLLHFDDKSRDSSIDINEFFLAFSRNYDISVVSLDRRLELSKLTANVGDNAEIRCDISGSPLPNIVWKRNGVLVTDVKTPHLQVFTDGSLYISSINQNLAGNYTCQAETNPEIQQIHVLQVNSAPRVWVDRAEIYTDENSEIVIRCDAKGVPRPQLFWLKNGAAIGSRPSVYTVSQDGGVLRLHPGAENDLIGTYTCQAKNAAGFANADVHVKKISQEAGSKVAGTKSHSRLAVLHRDGISVYDGEQCRLINEVIGSERLSQTDHVCRSADQNCVWGDVARISENRLYVTQPNMNRVLLIDTLNSSVVEVINTDQYPVKLRYLPQQDQVWVLNWRTRSDQKFKLIQVIRSASEYDVIHDTVHLQPISRRIDLVADMLLASAPQTSGRLFDYGYITHANHRGMYKVDLSTLNFVKSIDFTSYNCVPAHAQFSTLFGYVIIGCMEPVTSSPNGQLLFDQLTDSVIAFNSDVIGRPLLTSDSLVCVTYHAIAAKMAADATKMAADVFEMANETLITVQKVTGNGLELMYRLRTPLLLSDVTLSRSLESRDYEMVASTFDLTQLMLLDIGTGKVDILPLSSVEGESTNLKNHRKRPITSPGGFSSLLAVTDDNTLFLVDTRKRSVTCQIAGFANVTNSVWLTNEFF